MKNNSEKQSECYNQGLSLKEIEESIDELDDLVIEELDFSLEDIEKNLEEKLNEQKSDYSFLRKEHEKIGNPDVLGDTVKNIIWEQLVSQIGINSGKEFIKENGGKTADLRKKAHIQTEENFEKGIYAKNNKFVDYAKRGETYEGNFVKKPDGSTKLNREGKKKLTEKASSDYDRRQIKGDSTIHVDHTVSKAENLRDPGLGTYFEKGEVTKIINAESNLNLLDARANQSKGDKPMKEWLETPDSNGITPDIKFNLNKEELLEKDRKSREEKEKVIKERKEKETKQGKKSRKTEAFKLGGKALKSGVMVLLSSLLKDIISKLVQFFKNKNTGIRSLLKDIVQTIKDFMLNLKEKIVVVSNVMFTTLLTSVLGPIVSIYKKVWSLLKEGSKTIKEAKSYLTDPINKDKPISEITLKVGQIVVTGLTVAGSLITSELFEKALMIIPGFAIDIPLLGSLANVLGIFLGAVVSGVFGAIIINLLTKTFNKRKLIEIQSNIACKGNEILCSENELFQVNRISTEIKKNNVIMNINNFNTEAAKNMNEDFVRIDNSLKKNSKLKESTEYLKKLLAE